MTNMEGWGYIFLFLVIVMFIIGSLELVVVSAILKRTTNRILHLGIPAIVLLLGYFLSMHADASLIVFGSFLLIGPMAALIPSVALPNLTDPESRLTRILVCYVAVSLFWIVLNSLFFSTGLAMNPEVFWDTPLSNAKIYAGIIVLDILVAFFIYGIMHVIRPTVPVNGEKPE
jgi:hypothetical protein